MVNPLTKSCKTILGTGNPGCTDGGNNAQFNEPGGLDTSPDGQTLYVADTNSNAICVVDLSNNSVTTVGSVCSLNNFSF